MGKKSKSQQAQATTTSQTDPARPRTPNAILYETDLNDIELAEDNVPPPAYGKSYGEICDEKNGTGSGASLTDDGRVNIRINHFNRRLSHILTPAIRQNVQDVQHRRSPPPPYIPPSLGGAKGVPPPPPLNIVIQVVGSRGDVQPFVALGKVLKDTYGHRVRLATHAIFKDFVQEHDLEFFSIGSDPSRLMAFMVKNSGLMPGFNSFVSGDVHQRRKDVSEYIQGCWRSCYRADDETDNDPSGCPRENTGSDTVAKHFIADCIIANPPSFAHVHCAEKLGIPLHIMFTMPYSPTQAFPHPLANIQSSNADPQLTNYISYIMIELLSWQGLGDIINRFRIKCLGLDPISTISAPGMLQRLKIPTTYCWSPALIPKPNDWDSHISISGFYFLNSASSYTPTPNLQAFLDGGPPPIYIGFGSIVLDNPSAMTELIFEAVRKTGQRVLLSKGWGGMGADGLHIPNDIFILGNVPHDWLFKHVSCVVHHGGAGTTAAGIAAGRPTVVVPFFGDQPFWGAMIARAGAGPDPVPYKQLTADKLANAINFCLKTESRERAKELASKIAAEQGSHVGAQSFHQHLEVDRLRCSLIPSRPAAWRVKCTKVRLSAFAAYTLANESLLGFSDLKLFRAQEYYTDEGPSDPVFGGFTAVLGAVGGMMMGIAEIPSETWRAVQIPARRKQQRPQALVPTIASRNETSPGQSETSLTVDDSLTDAESTSTIGSSSMIGTLQGRLNSKGDDAIASRFPRQNKSGSSKDTNMLRPIGVHMSKGAGRFARELVQAPVNISVNLTRGWHNVPKLWGDDTVRPQERVSDLKSGVKAVGREFGLGWYDGITGLVTQPWNGAQKEGASGFAKGVGKGVGGFIAKSGAACFGILSHTMQGVNKEVQKLFSSNVQNYILGSRIAQGYDEWLQSSDEEKQDIIAQWKLIQKYLKQKKRHPDEMLQGILEARRHENTEDTETEAHQDRGGYQYTSTGNSAGVVNTDGATARDSENAILANTTALLSVQEMTALLCGDTESETDVVEQVVQGDSCHPRQPQPQQQQQQQQQQAEREALYQQADQENLLQAIVASEVEAQQHANEALEYKIQLEQVMAKSVLEQ